MTIYIPEISELPVENMRLLDRNAKCSVIESDGVVKAFAYEWPDLQVSVNIMAGPELLQHLQGFIGHIRRGWTALGKPVDQTLEKRILSTTLALGFVVEGQRDPEIWRERVQNMIAIICSNTRGLLFWEGSVFDENAQQLFPT